MSESGGALTESPTTLDARLIALVALLALVASAPSLLNDFAYDDRWIIVTNPRVHSLSRWSDWFTTAYWPTVKGSLYRPLTTTGFALQWWMGGGSPLVFHIVCVALYVAGTVAVTKLAALLLPIRAAVIVGALFAVHPTHVEAVANVVGQSELWVGLVMVCATIVYIRARRAGPFTRRTTVTIAVLYLAAALFKEHGLTLPAWFLVAELTVLRDIGGPLRARLASLTPLALLMVAGAALAITLRVDVLGAVGGDVPHPALREVGGGGRVLIMLGLLPDLARLIVWPARLYADYSPDHVMVSATPSISQLNGIVVAIGMIVIIVAAWRYSRPAAFGVLIAAAAWLPTANLLFPSGILLSERTLYLPTAGALIAVGVGAAWFDRRYTGNLNAMRTGGALLATLLVLCVGRFVDRTRAWRSSVDLFWTMQRDEPTSFRARYAWGSVLFDRGDLRGGEREWRAAIRIYPNYPNVYADLAHRYREHGFCRGALPLYATALELDERQDGSRQGSVACYLALAQYRAARDAAQSAIARGDFVDWYKARIVSADSALAALDSLKR
ncbi:MAG TPA: tetratricopeptide repeat protein [Gemmatimonadaceae bacterium]|nr:tetratricopeptide repeat protein [Gemmatimonadaceae bacterium]